MKNISLHQIKLKKDLLKVKILKQNLTLSLLKYQKVSDRLDRYDKKNYSRKKKKLRQKLDIGKKYYCQLKELKRNLHWELKRYPPCKFYKQTVQNISYFNKEKIFIITHKRNTENKTFYWLKDIKNLF